MKNRILLWLMALSAAAIAAPEEGSKKLGRLFYNAEQRARIDAGPERPSAKPPRELRLDGILHSPEGRYTIWLDGETFRGEQQGIWVGTDRIQVRTESGRSIEIRVGARGKL